VKSLLEEMQQCRSIKDCIELALVGAYDEHEQAVAWLICIEKCSAGSTVDDFPLLELHAMFPRNFVQLFPSELLWRCSRSARYITKKRLQSRWCHHPKQQ
jgi:hypothetical protein